jgi:hypothetical protein
MIVILFGNVAVGICVLGLYKHLFLPYNEEVTQRV